MSQDIDIDENENLENVSADHLQTQTAQNAGESSTCLGQPTSISGHEASFGVLSNPNGKSNVACEPFGRNDTIEVDIA